MADLVTNVGKGRLAYYATLPGANDALIAVVLEASGLESDEALQDYGDLASMLAASNNEQITMGRKTLSGVTVGVNGSINTVSVDASDFTWVSATGNPTGKLVVCYDPDTTSGTDAGIIPLTLHDFAVTPDGTDVTIQVDAAGLATCSNA